MSVPHSTNNISIQRMRFARSPRIRPDLPCQEVVIPPPPMKASAGAGALLLTILPGLLMAGVMAAVGVVMHTSNWLIFSLPMAGVGILSSTLSYMYQRKENRRKEERRQSDYLNLLNERASDLHKLRRNQCELSLEKDPPVQECLNRVRNLNRRLWDRDPSDEDFLSIRIGIGEQPPSFRINFTAPPDATDDPLVAQAQQLVNEYRWIPEVPICIPLRQAGIAGFAGQRQELLSLLRAVLIQLATHHSPDEVKFILVFPEEESEEWEWARWLPHTWDNHRRQRYIANTPASAHLLFSQFEEMLSQRRRLDEGATSHRMTLLPWYVFLIADPSMVEDEPFLAALEREGPAHGMVTIYLAERTAELPRNCQCMVRISVDTPFVMYKVERYREEFFSPDFTSRAVAKEFSRLIAPIRPKQAQSREIPDIVTFLEMYGVRTLEELNIAQRWGRVSEKRRTLSTPIGFRAGREPLLIDLHEKEHGPNGLIAGMVGGGKSELLQTLILSMAVNYHPYQVGFVIIDYKGGGMADPFVDLPHTLGIITNLQVSNLATRALTSFSVELTRRQKLFAKYGVTHIDDYQRLYFRGEASEPLPYLVIIVDEFAAMKAEKPEVASEFVKIAQLGRALGFRLILAMQKPAGIVDGQIEANTRFRLCLRVAQTEDSQAMLKRTDAAFLKGVGRAIFQVGANEIFEEFQVAWCGAEYDPDLADLNALEIDQVELNGQRRTLYRPRRGSVDNPTTQLKACIQHINGVAKEQNIHKLQPLWLDPLPAFLSLDDIRPHDQGWSGEGWKPGRRWLSPVIGIMDLVKNREQPPCTIDIGRMGNLIVYGGPGFGKTTFILTLITSLCLDHSPGEVHFYLLDFGSKALLLLRNLPHVGAIITSDDQERIQRFFQLLSREMERRNIEFASAGATNLRAYCEITGRQQPEFCVILDNLPLFTQLYEDYAETLIRVAREGPGVGIHLIVTANDSSSVRFSLATNINLAVALHLIERGEYASIVGRVEGDFPEAIPGRALMRGKPPVEIQIALPSAGTTEADRIYALRTLSSHMRETWQGPVPLPVESLPEELPLSRLVDQFTKNQGFDANGIPIGLEVQSLDPFLIDPRSTPIITVAGPPQCGRTSLLQTIITAFAYFRSSDHLQLFLIDSQRMELRSFSSLPHCREYAPGGKTAGEILDVLINAVQERNEEFTQQMIQPSNGAIDNSLSEKPLLMLVIDDFMSDYYDSIPESARDKLLKLIRLGRRSGLVLFVGVSSNDWKSYETICKELKSTGIMLGFSDSYVFDLRLRHSEADKALPLGEGYWTNRGRSRHVKFASIIHDSTPFPEWIETITQKEISYQTSKLDARVL